VWICASGFLVDSKKLITADPTLSEDSSKCGSLGGRMIGYGIHSDYRFPEVRFKYRRLLDQGFRSKGLNVEFNGGLYIG